MSDHETVRLETPGGDVVAYLAPEAVVRPAAQADLEQAEQTPSLDTPLVANYQTVATELQVTALFPHTDQVPQPHRDALQAAFGTLPISPRDQARRVRYFMAGDGMGGPFYFYDGPDNYDVEPGDSMTVDWETNFPTVQIKQFRTRELGGTDDLRLEATFRLAVGWQT